MEFSSQRERNFRGGSRCMHEVILKVLCMYQETGEIGYLEIEIGGLPGNMGSKSAKSFNK